MPQRCVILCLLMQFCGLLALGQSYTLRLHAVDAPMAKDTTPNRFFNDPGAVFAFLQTIITEKQENGFLASSIDSITQVKDLFDAYIYTGKKYIWARIGFDSLPPALLVFAGVNPKQWVGYPLKPKLLARLCEKLLVYEENNGFPFARVGLDNSFIDSNGGVYGQLKVNQGRYCRIDSITLYGDVKISPSFLTHYLNIHSGDEYNEQHLKTISKKIKELPFVQETQPWNVAFKFHETRLNLYLKDKKANQLNALIGLLPNSGANGGVLFTVDALLALQNILGKGESINLIYQNLQYKSPNLRADAVLPYILNTPIGIEAHFTLYKKDTTYRRTTFQGGGRYEFSANEYVRVYYQNNSNRLITIDTAYVVANHKLPADADVSVSGAGAELVLNETDYRLNPKKGYQVRFSAAALKRNIRQSDAITKLSDGTGFSFASLYDSLGNKPYQYHISADIAYYIPFGKQTTIKTAYSGGIITGDNLFQNELYQLGGFRLLRGFDELSIYANQYHILTIEPRLLISQNSYVYAFSDNAYIITQYAGYSYKGLYNGFGVGTTLETKTGIFSISIGLGKSNTQDITFTRAKVHFGFVGYF